MPKPPRQEKSDAPTISADEKKRLSLEELHELIEKQLTSEKINKALKNIDLAAKIDPNHPFTLFYAAKTFIMQKKYDQALVYYKLALKNNAPPYPYNALLDAQCQQSIMIILESLNKPEEALEQGKLLWRHSADTLSMIVARTFLPLFLKKTLAECEISSKLEINYEAEIAIKEIQTRKKPASIPLPPPEWKDHYKTTLLCANALLIKSNQRETTEICLNMIEFLWKMLSYIYAKYEREELHQALKHYHQLRETCLKSPTHLESLKKDEPWTFYGPSLLSGP